MGNDRTCALAALQFYDVLLVNPIIDGMNLVAKEGPVVNQRDGVLVLTAELVAAVSEVITALQQGRIHEMVPFAGQTAGLIGEILPAGEIVCRIVAEAEEALKRVTQLLT